MSAPPAPMPPDEPPALEQRLRSELERLAALCDGLGGAALATSDGLALHATGMLRSDTAAAAAGFLLAEIGTHLGLLRRGAVNEVLVWTDSGPWYLTCVPGLPYVLLLCATPAAAAPTLRHAGALACAHLAPLLAALEPA